MILAGTTTGAAISLEVLENPMNTGALARRKSVKKRIQSFQRLLNLPASRFDVPSLINTNARADYLQLVLFSDVNSWVANCVGGYNWVMAPHGKARPMRRNVTCTNTRSSNPPPLARRERSGATSATLMAR